MTRYNKQELVRQIGKKGQKKISKSSIVIVGVGALGSNFAELAVRTGIGKIILIDYDIVSESNLQRQRLFDEKDIGTLKVVAAKKKLTAINSKVKIETIVGTIDIDTINYLKGDIIAECSDNMKTKAFVNDYCKKIGKPLIVGSVAGVVGYSIFVKKNCIRDVFKLPDKVSSDKYMVDYCSTTGVMNTLTTVISSIMFNFALKYIIEGKVSDVVYFDGWKNTIDTLKISKKCKVCKNPKKFYLENYTKDNTKFRQLCGGENYMVYDNYDLKLIRKKLISNKVRFIDHESCLKFSFYTVMKNRMIVKAASGCEFQKRMEKFISYL